MSIKETVSHIKGIIFDRVVENSLIRNSAGRVTLVNRIREEVRAGGEPSPKDLRRISQMPPSWQETARILIESARLERAVFRLKERF